MAAMAPTFSQIKAQVASTRRKYNGDRRAIGIHCAGLWTGQRRTRDGDEVYQIEQCDSPLALRIALRQQDPESTVKVLLTSVDGSALEEDIRIRLAGRKLNHIDSWEILRTFFQFHAFDSRLRQQQWMADQLLAFASEGECPVAPGGFLDMETAWGFLLRRGLGLNVTQPDLTAVLKWSLEPDNVQRFKNLSGDFRDGCVEWLAERAGPAVRLVMQCLQTQERSDAVALGLAVHVIFNPDAANGLETAVVRFEERFFEGTKVEAPLACRWGSAASEVVRLQMTDNGQRDSLLKRSDAILRELRADSHAFISDVSLIGFDQRLGRFGAALRRSIESGLSDDLASSRDAVKAHEQAKCELRRFERVEMAMRLVRWLERAQSAETFTSVSFSEDVRAYLSDGSFVDWARLSLRNGDAVAELSDAYAVLFRKCQAVQEHQAEQFAKLLQDWTFAGSYAPGLIGVEHVLSRLVAPLAEHRRVLLVVMDGMSAAVFNQLIEDITKRDWVLLAEAESRHSPAGLATIPSATEFSRTSLLCGELKPGNATTEQTGFARHPDLVARSRASKPPLLYHKMMLHDTDDGALPPKLRQLIASPEQHIVGVVVNAIDDYLLKGEQIAIRWSRDEIKALPTLLHESQLANRIVVMVSDHGHILEYATTCTPHEGGDRWRHADSKPGPKELKVRGGRVLTEDKEIVAPWSETLRYGIKKNGYHGGLNPQEMVVPIAVLARDDSAPPGWIEQGLEFPLWWDDATAAPSAHAVMPAIQAPPIKTPTSLLDWREQSVEPTPPAATPPVWIQGLLSSPVFSEQKRLAGRSYPKDENVFVALLNALGRGGGKLTSTALSRAIGYPQMRMRGLLAVAQRVLNLDGYEVLSRDEDSDTIELNVDLLRKQFELE